MLVKVRFVPPDIVWLTASCQGYGILAASHPLVKLLIEESNNDEGGAEAYIC